MKWSCPSTCPSQCDAFPLIMCLCEPSLLPVWGVTTSIRTFTHLPCNSWPCWCLPDLKKSTHCVFNLSENLLPDTSRLASQFSDIQNMSDRNQMNQKMFVNKAANKKKVWVLVKLKRTSIESQVLFLAPYWLTLVFPWYLSVAMVNSLLRPYTSEEQLLFAHNSPLLCTLLFPDNFPLSVADFESLLPNSFESDGHVFIAPR